MLISPTNHHRPKCLGLSRNNSSLLRPIRSPILPRRPSQTGVLSLPHTQQQRRSISASSSSFPSSSSTPSQSSPSKWRMFWTVIDITSWLGTVGTAAAFLITQEVMLAGAPLILPLIALFAASQRQKLDSKHTQALLDGKLEDLLTRIESLPLSAAQNVASEVRAAVDAQPTITERTVKALEAKLSSMEGSFVSVGTAVRAALKESSTQQAQQGRDVVSKIDSLGGSIHKEVAVELRNAAADERAALGRLESRVGGLEGAITGLEVAQGEGMRRLGSTVSSLLVDAEGGLQSAVREETWKSLEPVRRLPQLLANLPALQQPQQQQQLDMMLPHLSEESLRELMREQFNAATSQLLTAQEQLLFEIKSVASAATLRAEEIAAAAAALSSSSSSSSTRQSDDGTSDDNEQQPMVADISPTQWNQLGRRLLAMDERLRELQQQQTEILAANISPSSSLFVDTSLTPTPPPPPPTTTNSSDSSTMGQVIIETTTSNTTTDDDDDSSSSSSTPIINTASSPGVSEGEGKIPITSWLSQSAYTTNDAVDTTSVDSDSDVDVDVGASINKATTTTTTTVTASASTDREEEEEEASGVENDVPPPSVLITPPPPPPTTLVTATSSYSSDMEDATELIQIQQQQEEEVVGKVVVEEETAETATTAAAAVDTATNATSNDEEMIADLCTKGLQLLKGGRAQASAPNGSGDFGVADAAFWEAADCFERALDIDPTNVRALGNLGNVLMSHGRLKWKLLLDVVESQGSSTASTSNGEDRAVMAAIQASKNRLRAEAEELLLLAGRRYRAVLELDRAQPKALMNWGRVICLRGEMARSSSMGESEGEEEEEEGLRVAAQLFSNAADKFDAALELSDPGDIIPLKLEARALLDAGVCLGQLVVNSSSGGRRRKGDGDRGIDGAARQAKRMLRESERALQEILDVYPNDEEVLEGIENCRGWLNYLSSGGAA